jgi:acyl-CoA reductase-like NAD-dependent aldehyde dehydrogenase
MLAIESEQGSVRRTAQFHEAETGMDNTVRVPELVTSIVNGESVGAKGHKLPVCYPGNGTQVSELVEANAAEVNLAVGAARRAFDSGPWPRMGVAERQQVLHQIRDVIRRNADELAYLECLNTGVTLRSLRGFHVGRAAYNFDFFAEYISQSSGEVYTQTDGFLSVVTREPVGVAGLIAPWNAPLALATMKVAAAIAFGNTCVLKPSELTPLGLARFVELLRETDLPPGVVNLVNGRGPETGNALVSHPDVDLVSFTGGTETGRHIMAEAGKRLCPVTMELGGKAANIVLESADLDRALDGALIGIYANNGQQCLAGSRILLERPVAETFLERFRERSERIRVGDPMAEETEIGPLISEPHLNRVLSYVAVAEEQGARLLTGGKRLADAGTGYYMAPTAVVANDNRDRVCQEEIFGPFATFLVFDTIDEAIGIANDTAYGLTSYLWSDDLPTVMRVSHELRSGVVWVNTPMTRELRAPFGGYKDSGVGREGGGVCEQFYTEEKTTTIPLEQHPLVKFGGAE